MQTVSGVAAGSPKGGRPMLNVVSTIVTIVSIVVTLAGIYVAVKHTNK